MASERRVMESEVEGQKTVKRQKRSILSRTRVLNPSCVLDPFAVRSIKGLLLRVKCLSA